MRNQVRRIVSIIVLLSASAQADVSNISCNSTYLINTKYIGPTSGIVILERSRQLALAQQYSDMVRVYEAKRDAGTLSVGDQANYNNMVSAFSQEVFNEVKNYQQSSYKNQLITSLKKNDNVVAAERMAKYPAMIVAGTISVYNGASYTVYKTDNFSFTPGESIKNRSVSLAVSSVVLNASVAASTESIITNINRGLINHVSVNYTNTTPVQTGVAIHTVSFNYGIPL